MKVAIIAPPYPLEEAPSPPLGVTYVAAAFEAAGAEVRIFDYIVSQYTREKLKRQLEDFAPRLVGATSVTMNFRAAASIIRDVKELEPSIITIMGGPHVSFDAADTLKRYPELDIIVMGEGERTIGELMEIIQGGGDLSSVKGIAFRSGGEAVVTEPRELIENLDSLPMPARHLLSIPRYRALGFPVSIITSRGCPNACIFCLGRRMVGKKVRNRNPLSVVDEIEMILGYGFSRINIADDLFTASPLKVREVCEEIIRRRLRFSWSAFSRVNTISREMLAMMGEAGCDAVSFGIESGNRDMLNRVRKGITLERAREAVQMCKDEKMLAHASFMVGLPGETAQTLEETKSFAESLCIPYGYHFFAPFPGTTVRENLDAFDIEILTDDWNRYDANSAIVQTSGLKAHEMNRFVADMENALMRLWQESVRRYHEGAGTAEENFAVEGRMRTEIMYRILSEDLVERYGTLNSDPSFQEGTESIRRLSKRITAAIGGDPDLVSRVLENLADQGHISIRRGGKERSWCWSANPRAGSPGI
ncbi:MAG: radical SAM protein [Syntrophales bacterium]|nr:radical SAM protein [Syntrophales bacterium]